MALTTFSKQQLEAANEIVTRNEHWVVLQAQMQSGKTDTYLFVAAEMLFYKKVKHVIIMCGNGEIELKTQLIKDLKAFEHKYNELLEVVLGKSVSERREIREQINLDDNIKIRYGADLASKHDHVIGDMKDTLLIWDESHHAAGQMNRPNKFLKRMGISADGNPLRLEGEEQNTYVLSVSATPFAELSDFHHESQRKEVVVLQPGDGYRGVAYYLNKIISFADWSVTLPEILHQYAAKSASAKYALIRINGDEDMEKARKITDENGWLFKVFDAENVARGKKTHDSSIMQSLDELAMAPLKNTVIFIRGMCRMGKKVPKQHLAFVMETARNPNTDTVLQGLLGRMCGYHEVDIGIYLHKNMADKITGNGTTELEKFVEGSLPVNAAHMSKARETVFDAFPIVLRGLVEDQADPDYLECSADKTRAFAKNGILTGNGVVRNDNGPIHSADIRRQIASAETHVTVHDVCKPNVNISYASVPALFEGILAGTQVKKAVRSLPSCGLMSDGKEVNAWVFKTNKYESLGFEIGTIIVQAACKMTADGESAVPKTKGTEAFTSKQEDGTEVASNGSCAVTISPATATSVSAMKSAIDELVRMSLQKREAVTVSRCITSNWDAKDKWQGILINDVVSQALKKTGDIYKFIKSKHGVMLKITRRQGPSTAACKASGLKRVCKIEW